MLAAILECYPESDLFCLFDILSDDARARLGGKRSRSTFLQTLPGIARNHRRYLPLMPIAIEQLDLSGYDLELDYDQPPVTTLSAGELAWIDKQLRAAGLRS